VPEIPLITALKSVHLLVFDSATPFELLLFKDRRPVFLLYHTGFGADASSRHQIYLDRMSECL
jgi:hypothetical protein